MHRNFPLCSANHFPYPESVCAYAAGVDVPYFGEKKGKLSIHWGELGVREKCDHRNVCPLGTVAGDAVEKQEEQQQQQQRKTTHPHIVSHVAVARAAEVNGPRCKLVFPWSNAVSQQLFTYASGLQVARSAAVAKRFDCFQPREQQPRPTEQRFLVDIKTIINRASANFNRPARKPIPESDLSDWLFLHQQQSGRLEM